MTLKLQFCRRVMGAQDLGEFRALAHAMQGVGQRAFRIKQQKRHMRNAVFVGQGAAFFGFDIGDQKDQIAFAELLHGFAGFTLQCGAGWTIRIMDLHDRGLTLADPGQIMFRDCRHNGSCAKETRPTQNRRTDCPVARQCQNPSPVQVIRRRFLRHRRAFLRLSGFSGFFHVWPQSYAIENELHCAGRWGVAQNNCTHAMLTNLSDIQRVDQLWP